MDMVEKIRLYGWAARFCAPVFLLLALVVPPLYGVNSNKGGETVEFFGCKKVVCSNGNENGKIPDVFTWKDFKNLEDVRIKRKKFVQKVKDVLAKNECFKKNIDEIKIIDEINEGRYDYCHDVDAFCYAVSS